MDFLRPSSPAPTRLTVLVGCFVTAMCALLATVGADANWLAALGQDIARSWSIPGDVPYAAAASAGWHNVPVLGELIFHGLRSALGTRGLVLAQLTAVVTCLGLIATDLRRARVPDTPAALVLFLTAFASAPALLVVRSQLFSLALFPLLVLLLRAEARRPSRRVWLLVPLAALWSNLHGGVLLGIAVAAAYLLFSRARQEPLVAFGVLLGMCGALFATPALGETADYYRGVITSQAASHGEGLWQPLSLTAPFDVVFLAVAIPVVAMALRSRPAVWEVVVTVALAVAAVRSSRNEVWLALFVAVPAARALAGSRTWRLAVPKHTASAVTGLLVVVVIAGFAKTPVDAGASPKLLRDAVRIAHGTPILADGFDAEQLALAGDRILIGNPLDAFSPHEQTLYLDWLAGRPSGDAEAARVRAILVAPGSKPDARLAHRAGFCAVAREKRAVLYTNRCA
ncbi:MAG TPA: hypothetical protein VLJ76_04975 [Gaiellaceae bacterium]|nr:hypothetical protein [Gaiellaceae bacterium]